MLMSNRNSNVRSLLSPQLEMQANQQHQRFRTQFNELGCLAQSGFSKVFKVQNNIDHQYYAIKQIEINLLDTQNPDVKISRVLREAHYLAQLQHDNIIRYHNAWMEFSSNPIKSSRFLSEDDDDKIEQLGDLNSPTELDPQMSGRISYTDVEDGMTIKESSPLIRKLQFYKNKKTISQEYKFAQTNEKLFIYIQTEICEITLEDYIINRNKQLFKNTNNKEEFQLLNDKLSKETQVIVRQIINGLNYIHTKYKLVHRDLKPSNIYLNSPNDVKIGDFGLVKKFQNILNTSGTTSFGFIDSSSDDDTQYNIAAFNTQMYAAPEIITNNLFMPFDQRVDIYALALIILQLYYPTKTQMEMFKILQDAKSGSLPQRLCDKKPIISFIVQQCLHKDPKQRLTLEQICLKLNDVKTNSTTIDYEQQIIGDIQIQYEDEDEIITRYLTVMLRQLLIFKSCKHTKAQALYDLSGASIVYCEQSITIRHSMLAAVTIHCSSQEQKQMVQMCLQH